MKNMALLIEFVIWIYLVETTVASARQQPLKSAIRNPKHASAFNTLLQSVLDVNKYRYDAIKKMAHIEELSLYPSRAWSAQEHPEYLDNCRRLKDSPPQNQHNMARHPGWNFVDTDGNPGISRTFEIRDGVLGKSVSTEVGRDKGSDALEDSLTFLNMQSVLSSKVDKDFKPFGAYKSRDRNLETEMTSSEVYPGYEAYKEGTVHYLRDPKKVPNKCKRTCRRSIGTACDEFTCRQLFLEKLTLLCYKYCLREFEEHL